MAKGQVRVIKIQVSSNSDKEFRKIASGVKRASDNVKSLSFNLNTFRNIYATIMASQVVRYMVEVADSWQLARDRIKNFVGSAKEAVQVQMGIYQVALQNRTAMGTLAESYNRIGFATKDLKLNSKELTEVVRLLDLTYKVSGASATEASNSTIQLAQGLGAGALRGDEFRSVAENNVVLLGLLAKELGVTNGQLKNMAAEGKITADIVLGALVNNSSELEKNFKSLNPTMGQTAAIIGTMLAKNLDQVNQEFGITSGIINLTNSSISVMSDNSVVLSNLLSAGIAVALSIIIVRLYEMIKAVKLLAIANSALSKTNLIMLAISSAIYLIMDNWTAFLELVEKGWIRLKQVWSLITSVFTTEKKGFDKDQVVRNWESYNKEIEKVSQKYKKRREAEAAENSFANFTPSNFKFDEKSLEGFKNKLKDIRNVAKTKEGKYSLLNLNTTDLDQYKVKLMELQKIDLKTNFDNGKISLIEYTEKLDQLDWKYRELKNSSDQAMLGIKEGLRDYSKSATDLASNMRNFVTSTFSSLEDSLTEFVTTGKFKFKDFANSVIEDLTRIAIRKNITGALASSLGGGNYGAPAFSYASAPNAVASANGNVFHRGNIEKFASGGAFTNSVVGKPTYFDMGLMGEAGPEAIMPLSRGRNGKLGVKAEGMGASVKVNIINQASNEVETSESTNSQTGEKEITVLIKKQVKNLMSDGSLDRTFNSNYGLKRKGRA